MDPLGPVRLGLILDGTVPGAVLTYKIELRSWPDQFLGLIPCYPNVPLIDSSRTLVSIYAVSFVIRIYLILQINVQISNVTGSEN